MKKTTRRMMRRGIALYLIIMILGSLVFSLTSCGSSEPAKVWDREDYYEAAVLKEGLVDKDSFDINGDKKLSKTERKEFDAAIQKAVEDYDTPGSSLEHAIDLEFVAAMLAAHKNSNTFIAATRGYPTLKFKMNDKSKINYAKNFIDDNKDTLPEDILNGTKDEQNAFYLSAAPTVISYGAVKSANEIVENILLNGNLKTTTDNENNNSVQRIYDVLNATSIDLIGNEYYTVGLEASEKLLDDLYATGRFQSKISLNNSVGFPEIILVWIGKFLGWITNLVGGQYLVAIIIFALIIELVMSPLAIKQHKNTIGMAKLRPLIAKIEKKYAGRYDRATQQKKQQEIMELQQKTGFSPMSGCLPLILQLIVVGFILYPIIQNPLRYVMDTSSGFASALSAYVSAPESLGGLAKTGGSNVMAVLSELNSKNIIGITDFALLEESSAEACLAQFAKLDIPNFELFGINLGLNPTFLSILILVPILNVGSQLLATYLNKRWTGMSNPTAPEGQNSANTKLMTLLGPALTLIIIFQVPAMIGLYWFIRGLFSLGTKYIIKLAMPIPTYSEEELRDMEKAEKERQKAQKEASKATHRSLHYIDEDDYEELPDVASGTSNEKKSNSFSSDDRPELKD